MSMFYMIRDDAIAIIEIQVLTQSFYCGIPDEKILQLGLGKQSHNRILNSVSYLNFTRNYTQGLSI